MTAPAAGGTNHYDESYGLGMIHGSVTSPNMAAAPDSRLSPTQPNMMPNTVIMSPNDVNNTGGGSSSIKNMAMVQQAQNKAPIKKPVRRGIKQPPDRPQRALFFFTLKSPIRKICISVVEWKYPFDLFFAFFFFFAFHAFYRRYFL